jgi:hypothetical protein
MRDNRTSEALDRPTEKENNDMTWLYPLAMLALAVPSAVVSTLILVERGRKRGKNHANE